MKYLSFVLENQDIGKIVTNNEAIIEIASINILNSNIILESFIYNNLAQFTAGAESAADVYARIRDFVISENTAAYTQISEILADSELSADEKLACFSEGWAQNWMQPGGKLDPSKNPTGTSPKVFLEPEDSKRIASDVLSGNNDAERFRYAQAVMKAPRPLSAAETKQLASDTLSGKANNVLDKTFAKHAKPKYARIGPTNRAAEVKADIKAEEASKIVQEKPTIKANVSQAYDKTKSLASEAYDKTKELVSQHQALAGGLGVAAAGAGAYGIYKAIKAAKAKKSTETTTS